MDGPGMRFGLASREAAAPLAGLERLRAIAQGRLPGRGAQGRTVASAEARVRSRDGQVPVHGTATLIVPDGR